MVVSVQFQVDELRALQDYLDQHRTTVIADRQVISPWSAGRVMNLPLVHAVARVRDAL